MSMFIDRVHIEEVSQGQTVTVVTANHSRDQLQYSEITVFVNLRFAQQAQIGIRPLKPFQASQT